MSRKDYVKMAALLAGERAMYPEAAKAIDRITGGLADICKQDNARFDRQRFYSAAGRS